MANNIRLVLSVSEEDKRRIDELSAELGMNRSQYVRYLISGGVKLFKPSIQYQEFLAHFSSIDLSLRVIALKEEISSEDMLFIESSIKEMKRLLNARRTSGQVDQRLSEGGMNGRTRT